MTSVESPFVAPDFTSFNNSNASCINLLLFQFPATMFFMTFTFCARKFAHRIELIGHQHMNSNQHIPWSSLLKEFWDSTRFGRIK